MAIYLLKRLSDCPYDEYRGFVVRAGSEKEAREIVVVKIKENMDVWHHEETDIWLDNKESSCVFLDQDGDSMVVLADFKAG